MFKQSKTDMVSGVSEFAYTFSSLEDVHKVSAKLLQLIEQGRSTPAEKPQVFCCYHQLSFFLFFLRLFRFFWGRVDFSRRRRRKESKKVAFSCTNRSALLERAIAAWSLQQLSVKSTEMTFVFQ